MQIFYKPSFVRQYKKLPSSLQNEIKEKIQLFAVSPNHSFLKTHKLQGRLKNFYSFSVNYQYRVIFSKQKKSSTLLGIGNHDIYK